MSNHIRINKIFENAKRIKFTNNDRLVFFSDVHRGNNSWADEFAVNEIIYLHALQHYYHAGFTYVEVGDGDELLKFKYIEPIRIAHEDVFRLLQKFLDAKRLNYIYGNHDNDYHNPNLVHRRPKRIFTKIIEEPEIRFDDFETYEGLVFEHEESGVNFFTVHGHQGDDLFHRFIWISQLFLRFIWAPLQSLGFQDPTSIAQNFYKRRKVEEVLMNWCADNHQPLICGHTHKERFPKEDRAPYFNTGSCVYPHRISCIEIVGGKISLIRWRIKPDKKGKLVVKRSVQKGPRKIEDLCQSPTFNEI